MKLKSNHWVILLAVVLVLFIGCKGEDGATGPAGPAGPAGPQGPSGHNGLDLTKFSYRGNNMIECGHCHLANTQQWLGTKHHDSYASLPAAMSNNVYCLSCHTTGWDSPVAFGDSIITNYGPDRNGFDDYWGKTDSLSLARMEALKNVQCESCHGAANAVLPKVSFGSRTVSGVSQSLCYPCHDTQLEEWATSGHGTVLVNSGGTIEQFTAEFVRNTWATNPIGSLSNCWECHTSEGFIKANDPNHTNMAQPLVAELIGCPACHDPHKQNAANTYQLRNLTVDTATNRTHGVFVYSGYGTGQSCVQCHKDRRDSTYIAGQIINGSTVRFGPHESPQMDMFLGGGSYEISSYTYTRGSATVGHKAVAKGCVSCHMTTIGTQPHADHRFETVIAACTGCHPGATNFDIGGFQTRISTKMDSVLLLVSNLSGVDFINYPDSIGVWNRRPGMTANYRKALWAYTFVHADQSQGVHNPAYAISLLDNAITYLLTNP